MHAEGKILYYFDILYLYVNLLLEVRRNNELISGCHDGDKDSYGQDGELRSNVLRISTF